MNWMLNCSRNSCIGALRIEIVVPNGHALAVWKPLYHKAKKVVGTKCTPFKRLTEFLPGTPYYSFVLLCIMTRGIQKAAFCRKKQQDYNSTPRPKHNEYSTVFQGVS